MKSILWMSYLLAGMLVLIVLIGWMLPKEHTIARDARFGQPPVVIWKAITDIDAMPGWRPGLRSVKHLPDRNELPAWVETTDSGVIPFETVVSEPPSKLVVRIADPKLPFGGTWTYEITPLLSGTNLRIREDGEIYNPVFRFLSRFVYGYSRTMDTYLRALGRKFGEQAQIGN